MLPTTFGLPDYIAPIVVITVGHALFQTANDTAVMTDIRSDPWGVISGVLNLSRNLGLITGASVMGAAFALASAPIEITTAGPEAVAIGMRITFAVAAILLVVALAMAVGSRALATRGSLPEDGPSSTPLRRPSNGREKPNVQVRLRGGLPGARPREAGGAALSAATSR